MKKCKSGLRTFYKIPAKHVKPKIKPAIQMIVVSTKEKMLNLTKNKRKRYFDNKKITTLTFFVSYNNNIYLNL